MTKALLPSGILLLLAIVALCFAVACAKESASAPTQTAPPPPIVGVTPVALTNLVAFDDLPGRVDAVEEVELGAQIAGAVTAVKFVEGSLVKRGDVLIVIDARPYRALLARARAEETRASTRLELAQTEATRAERLAEGGAIPRREYETLRSASHQAHAEVGAAKAAASLAALDVEHTVIRAPIDGRVGRALVSVGDLVAPGGPPLTTLVSVDPVRVTFSLDEGTYALYAPRLRKGEAVEVLVGTMADAGYPFRGRVDFVANHLDAATGTIELRARIADPEHVLTPGQFARVRLAGESTPRVAIDERAVLTDQDRKYVLVVDATGTAQRKDVVLGRAVEGKRIVSKGLAAGDRVIVSNVARAMPGAPVTAEAAR